MNRRIFGLLAALALLGVMPSAPFDIETLSVGKAAPNLPASGGHPTVIVAFASWCIACMKEMPEVVADYAKFKDRVSFIGVDYLDNPKAGDDIVRKYGIPFPVVQARADANAPKPVDPNEKVEKIMLHGVTPKMLPASVEAFARQMPADLAVTLRTVSAYCEKHDDSACMSFAKDHGVQLDTEPGVTTTERSQSSTKNNVPTLSLPHLFVTDGSGIVRESIEGYETDRDSIQAALGKLGIK